MMTTTLHPEPLRIRHDADLLEVPAPFARRTQRPTLVAGEGVDAISIPASFGALVRAELEIMMLAGPVVDDGAGSWIFLTQPANSRCPAVPADLLPLGVRLIRSGTRVPVPEIPDHPPAIWSTVIGAARRVAYRTRRSVRR